MENGFISQLTCACYRRGVEIRDGESIHVLFQFLVSCSNVHTYTDDVHRPSHTSGVKMMESYSMYLLSVRRERIEP